MLLLVLITIRWFFFSVFGLSSPPGWGPLIAVCIQHLVLWDQYYSLACRIHSCRINRLQYVLELLNMVLLHRLCEWRPSVPGRSYREAHILIERRGWEQRLIRVILVEWEHLVPQSLLFLLFHSHDLACINVLLGWHLHERRHHSISDVVFSLKVVHDGMALVLLTIL